MYLRSWRVVGMILMGGRFIVWFLVSGLPAERIKFGFLKDYAIRGKAETEDESSHIRYWSAADSSRIQVPSLVHWRWTSRTCMEKFWDPSLCCWRSYWRRLALGIFVLGERCWSTYVALFLAWSGTPSQSTAFYFHRLQFELSISITFYEIFHYTLSFDDNGVISIWKHRDNPTCEAHDGLSPGLLHTQEHFRPIISALAEFSLPSLAVSLPNIGA